MTIKSSSSEFTTKILNRHGLHVRWPRIWIIILGIVLIFLCFVIVGMEIGHTIADVYRSTAFGGFILFIPLLICAIFVLLTGFRPRSLFLRIAVILCCIMIILCVVLIAYDILVLIDPTRCFFLNCNNSVVNATNSTTNVTVTGWPIYITWPQYFQNNMNNKRIFQSIQILAAGLFILCCSLYLLTYYIYRHLQLDQHAKYVTEQRTLTNHEINRVTPLKPILRDTSRVTMVNQKSFENNETTVIKHTAFETHRATPIGQPTVVSHGLVPVKQTSSTSPAFPRTVTDHKVRTFTIDGQSTVSNDPSVIRSRSRLFTEPTVISSDSNPLCRRCQDKPRMILATDYEKENYFPHLCINCNTELANIRFKPTRERKASVRKWKR